MGLYSGNPAFLYGVGRPLRHQRMAQTSSPQTYLFQIDSILPDDQSMPNPSNLILGGLLWHLRFFARTAVDWMSTRHGSTPVSESPTQTDAQSISRLAFLLLQKDCKSCLTGLPNTTVPMFVWNPPASSGFRYSTSWKRPVGSP